MRQTTLTVTGKRASGFAEIAHRMVMDIGAIDAPAIPGDDVVESRCAATSQPEAGPC